MDRDIITGVGARVTYATTLTSLGDGRVCVPVPFDPDERWGPKLRHTITGTVDGILVRGVLQPVGGGHGFTLGHAWRRERDVEPGQPVTVVIEAEGPQRGDLAEDVASARAADERAGEAFDALAQSYRKAFLAWIDATKRRPEQRAICIAEMVELLRAGKKERA